MSRPRSATRAASTTVGTAETGPYAGIVTLRLYDTGARAMRDFVPLVPGQVTIYLCGATVQSPPHIGHIRSGLDFDILRRWLEHEGYQVTFCRNVTDIDDKVLAERCCGDSVVCLGGGQSAGFHPGLRRAGVPATDRRAAGNRSRAGDDRVDASPDRHWSCLCRRRRRLLRCPVLPGRGQLSGQRLDAMSRAPTATVPASETRATSLCGRRPSPGAVVGDAVGTRASGVAPRVLGDGHEVPRSEFDIHGGGLDLVFPHHENEPAQSRLPATRSRRTGCTTPG